MVPNTRIVRLIIPSDTFPLHLQRRYPHEVILEALPVLFFLHFEIVLIAAALA